LTFEEGTSADWLNDLLKPPVSRLVVCDPRKNALSKDGNKGDLIDPRKLAELLRTKPTQAVYHEEHGVRTLKELGAAIGAVRTASGRNCDFPLLIPSGRMASVRVPTCI